MEYFGLLEESTSILPFAEKVCLSDLTAGDLESMRNEENNRKTTLTDLESVNSTIQSSAAGVSNNIRTIMQTEYDISNAHFQNVDENSCASSVQNESLRMSFKGMDVSFESSADYQKSERIFSQHDLNDVCPTSSTRAENNITHEDFFHDDTSDEQSDVSCTDPEDNYLNDDSQKTHDFDNSDRNYVSESDDIDVFEMPEGQTFGKRKNRNSHVALSRKRKRTCSQWIDIQAKNARDGGVPGVGRGGIPIFPKRMGAGCTNCRFRCNEKITIDERRTIHTEFWGLNAHERQWDYIARFVETREPSERKTKQGGINRAKSHCFTLEKSNEKIKVCRTMFLHTLGISQQWLKTVANKSNNAPIDQRGRHSNRPKRLPTRVRESVKEHIKSFVTVESHYCRKTTNKTFLEESLSIAEMYRRYRVWMIEKEDQHVACENLYRKIFNHDFNIEFHKLKKDLCDQCTAFRYLTEEQKKAERENQDIHVANKNKARSLMAQDKEEAKADTSICVACFDVEKTLTTPRSNVSMMYYKRKLSIYNFTVYDLHTHEGVCYVWNETIGGKGANEISSCLWKYIRSKVSSGVKDFRFYSDNCGAQNRNKMLYSMYGRAAKKYGVVITHRYLEKGHTYNEGDSMHARIENSCKNTAVFSQEQWCEIMREAKHEEPSYVVHEMPQNEIYDFSPLANDQNWKKMKIMQLREVKIDHNTEKVYFKYSYAEEESQSISLHTQKSVGKKYPLKRAHDEKIQLDGNKKKDLEFMCKSGVIPEAYHRFYREIME